MKAVEELMQKAGVAHPGKICMFDKFVGANSFICPCFAGRIANLPKGLKDDVQSFLDEKYPRHVFSTAKMVADHSIAGETGPATPMGVFFIAATATVAATLVVFCCGAALPPALAAGAVVGVVAGVVAGVRRHSASYLINGVWWTCTYLVTAARVAIDKLGLASQLSNFETNVYFQWDASTPLLRNWSLPVIRKAS